MPQPNVAPYMMVISLECTSEQLQELREIVENRAREAQLPELEIHTQRDHVMEAVLSDPESIPSCAMSFDDIVD